MIQMNPLKDTPEPSYPPFQDYWRLHGKAVKRAVAVVSLALSGALMTGCMMGAQPRPAHPEESQPSAPAE